MKGKTAKDGDSNTQLVDCGHIYIYHFGATMNNPKTEHNICLSLLSITFNFEDIIKVFVLVLSYVNFVSLMH